MASKSDGILPLNRLARRLTIESASSFCRMLDGIWPLNPTPGRRSEVTRVPFGLHETPTHEVQICLP